MSEVYLRSMTMEDLEYTNKWHSDQGLYESLVGPFRYVSKDAEEEWLRRKVTFSNEEINLIICLKDHLEPIGMVSVREIDWVARKGYLSGILIGQSEFLGKGYGTEALKTIVSHCFRDLGLNRIFAHILEDNLSSISTFKKCGFQVEGQMRQHAFKNGQFKDVLIVGLCADQYFQKRNL